MIIHFCKVIEMKAQQTKILESYIPLVKFLATFFGEDCEVVLHDLRNIESSIIAIENNHISGRNVGGPLTDLCLRIIKDKKYLHADFIKDYKCIAKDGKQLQSATYFIKDETEFLLGLLCINMDISNLINAKQILEKLISGFSSKKIINKSPLQAELEKTDSEYVSHLSIEDLMNTMIIEVIAKSKIPPERMVADEKLALVNALNEKGVFLIKGSVAEVANRLKTSEATIYRYIKQLTK